MSSFIYSKAPHRLINIPVIEDFPYIYEFGHEKYSNIRPASLELHYHKGIEICFVKKGRYDWQVGTNEYTLYPGEGFITCPWENHGNSQGFVNLGEIYWLIISPERFTKKEGFHLSDSTSFNNVQETAIAKVLCDNTIHLLSKGEELEKHFEQLNKELVNRELGFDVMVKSLVESILLEVIRIILNRKLEISTNNAWILQLKMMFESDISRKWNINRMAENFNMGTTSFNEKVKRLTGFTPQSFLIDLKVEFAKQQLAETSLLLTDIALNAGFYSSQHFSATFLKRVGMTPSLYRKKHKVIIT